MEGIIVDETKHTFVLETSGGMRRIFKHIALFEFLQKGMQFRVQGKLLVGRPEDRIKRKMRRI